MWIFDGNQIKVARDVKDVTQAELAVKLGVPTQHVSMWECGKVEPNMKSFTNLCNALDVKPQFFFVDSVHFVDSQSKQEGV